MLAAAFAAFVLAAPAGAADFAGLTPADASTISYKTWYDAGSYVRFTIKPDSAYPCGSEYYYLEVNGHPHVAQFSADCAASVYLSTPGRYSWRTELYVFQTGTTITGPVSTFTVASTDPPAAVVPSHVDTKAPSVKAFPRTLSVGVVGRLLYGASDNSGAGRVNLALWRNQTLVWIRSLDRRQIDDALATYAALWRPKTQGPYRFCVDAEDLSGNQSRMACVSIMVTRAR